MSTPAPVYYDEQRRIRVGMDADGQEITKRLFKRANRGRAEASYSKCYVGNTEKTVANNAITTWGLRYGGYTTIKRATAIKDDWLAHYQELDIAKTTQTEAEKEEEPKRKKQKTEHEDVDLLNFLNGEEPTKRYTAELAQQLVAKHHLKCTPSHVNHTARIEENLPEDAPYDDGPDTGPESEESEGERAPGEGGQEHNEGQLPPGSLWSRALKGIT
ncbi:hypothetical protein T440DRAFT_475997 [Plenodomus tracheiphilus IPT5]|uniref:Uncharacterized protein n=1 Tax=Plenodomus tracheiphilus IPT5 TaxID=1408161 RepID=A0A6A7BFM1_9PLEO|nr:hypothetical protein T440DRAFT_475997 [Plenodomus tracheiphilus IPT5]